MFPLPESILPGSKSLPDILIQCGSKKTKNKSGSVPPEGILEEQATDVIQANM